MSVPGIELKVLWSVCAMLAVVPAAAAPTEWLEGTVLESCEPCRTEAFQAERRRIANQAGVRHDPASGMGYIVTMEPGGLFVWGRAALVGTGNLIRTDAHVLFADTGRLKTPDRRVYFEPMQHGGSGNLIEVDLQAVQRGGPLGPLETDVRNDWAIARLKEDAIEKFRGERVFAFLWDVRATHAEILQPDYRQAAALVVSGTQQFRIHESCENVTDDEPADHVFGIEEIFFTRCPAEHLQVGASGSALAILSPDDTWHLAGQLVAGGASARAPNAVRQIFLGNAPMLRQTLTIVYLDELIRRGLDPRNRLRN